MMRTVEEALEAATAALSKASKYCGLDDKSREQHWEAIGEARYCLARANEIMRDELVRNRRAA